MNKNIYFIPKDNDIEYLKEIEDNKKPLYAKLLQSHTGSYRCYLTRHIDGCDSNKLVDKKNIEFENLSFLFMDLNNKFDKFFNKYLN